MIHPQVVIAYAAVFAAMCAFVVAVAVSVIAQRMRGHAYAYERFEQNDKKKEGLVKELERKVQEMKKNRDYARDLDGKEEDV